ncbi:MAG TPA: hypothetical protein VG319_07525, partial [Polyangia bacterium]|nr:hypothetical protein [Polyangia bacterium]
MGAIAAASTLIVGLAGCGGHSSGTPHADASADGRFDARDAAAESRDVPAEAPSPDAACIGDAAVKRAAGQACGCASDCASNFCVDG